MTALIDISIPLHHHMIHWPDDPPVEITSVCDVQCGDFCTVRRLNMGSHTGTHVDAFSHFLPEGASLSEMPLHPYIGPAKVMFVDDEQAISRASLAQQNWQHSDGSPVKRVLLKSRNSLASPPWYTQPFDKHFIHLSPEAAEFLVEKQVALVGVDALSVDGYHADNVPVHRILLPAGVYPLEGLALEAVEPGEYELICLPLAIQNGDGAPARAVLKPL